MTRVNWADFARRHWDREPVRLRDVPPFDARTAFAIARAASEPLMAGMRFRALPAVRFFVQEAYLSAPGTLLPGPQDAHLDGYLDRVARNLRPPGFQLRIHQPLILGFPWWAAVRDRLQLLWSQVGWPVSPVETELNVGTGLRQPRDDHIDCAELQWVLQGKLRVQLEHRYSNAPLTLHARSGDLLYWPDSYVCRESWLERGVALRLLIPLDRRQPATQVNELAAEILQRARGTNTAVPYVLDRAIRDNRAPTLVAPLVTASAQLRAVLRGADLRRRLRVEWARRVSAAALEPVPPARKDAVVPSTAYLRMPRRDAVVRADRDVWAVNGHAFTVRGAGAGKMLTHLQRDAVCTLDELCKAGGAGAMALLCRLHALHAVEIVDVKD